MDLDLLFGHQLDFFNHLAHKLLVGVGLTHALIDFLHESLTHLDVFLLVGHGYVVLDLAKVLAIWLQAPLRLLSVLQWALFLELVDLFQEWDTLNASLFGVVAKMAESVFDADGDLDHFFERIHLAFENLSENLVDVVRVTSIHSNLESLQVVASLQIEGNLLDDLLLVQDQKVAKLLPMVLSKLSQLGKVNSKLYLI